jgi:hypothetical protein
VVFLADNLVLGEASVTSQGTATLEVAGVFPGSHYFTAVLSGAGDGASSAATTLVGSPISGLPEFAMLFSAPSANLTVNQPALLQLEVDPINGFNGQIQLSCSQSVEVSCSFRPASLGAGGKSILVLTLIPQTNSGSAFPSLWYSILGLSAAWTLFSRLALARRRERLAAAALGLICLAAVFGCGGKDATSANLSTITVTASSSQPAMAHSVTLAVSIH